MDACQGCPTFWKEQKAGMLLKSGRQTCPREFSVILRHGGGRRQACLQRWWRGSSWPVVGDQHVEGHPSQAASFARTIQASGSELWPEPTKTGRHETEPLEEGMGGMATV